MDPERSRKIEELYEAALEVEPARRTAFLTEHCAGDESLRLEVESLLLHDADAGRFLEVPALEMLPDRARLEIGQHVSHYEIQEKLGEGGMGVVYKARDTRLGRSVALKFVKAQFSERFEREARAVAALNHPHIATLHDVGEHEGAPYLAMEFVEGQPLKGPRPVTEVIQYGIQMAEALAAAHAAGIVHRDLKPANILVTKKGSVKILDFGLAKLRAQIGDATPATLTLTAAIAGTPGYMSPEQIDGKPVDSRSDIFAFGCVLYELASGRRAFEGNSVGSVLAATATSEPKPLDGVPPELDKLIRRCLRKDPARRYQHMDELKLVLEEMKNEPASGRLPGSSIPELKRPWRWPWAAAATGALLLAAVLVWRLREASPPSDPSPVPLTAYSGTETQPSFSPDGSKVAFTWNGEKEDNTDIYVKQIGSTGPPMRLTTSPAAESYPAWSPDDRWIAFTRQQPQGNSAIMLVSPLGGQERKLTEMINVLGLSWAPGAKWLAVSGWDSPEKRNSIWAINIDTGERHRLTTPKPTEGVGDFFPAVSPGGGLGDRFPAISPDGRSLAFVRPAGYYVFELLMLRLTRDLQPAGEPSRVTDHRYANIYGLAWTADGRDIVYAAGGNQITNLWRVPVSGRQTPRRLPYVLPSAVFPAIARTPPSLVYTWSVYSQNLWRLDTHTGERRMLIGSTYYSQIPQYSPDGRKIAFDSNRSGSAEVWTCDADGSNCQQLTSFGGPLCGTARWSPDGRWLALDSRAEGQPEIYVIAADGGTPRRMTNHPANDMLPSWSRDGRWIYFDSDRSGRDEIWKIPAGGGQAIQVTRSGGVAPLESPDGNIYYVKGFRPSALFKMPVGGGEEKQVLPTVTAYASFGVTAKGVYFKPDGSTIQFLDMATGKVRTLATLDRPGKGGICVSPDDAYVVFGQVDRDTQDLMLVEGFR